MSRRPKALITGFTGMVGSHLADHLLAHTDWELTGLLRWNEDLKNVDHLLDRVNQKDRSLTGRQGTGDLISKVNVTWGVNQIQDVFRAVRCLIRQSNGLGFNRDPALTLNIHPVQVLRPHGPGINQPRVLKHPVSEC
jgi:GDP-D-mannose dehydratase